MDIKNHLKYIGDKVDNIIVLDDSSTKFIYIKISKTAGTYLHRGFFDKYYQNNKNYFNYKDDRKRFNAWLNGESDFNKYFIFSFVRNTFTRVISAYYYNIKKRKTIGNNVDIKRFVLEDKYHNHSKYHIFSQYDTLFIANNEIPFVDEIYFYENLDNSIIELCAKLNIETFIEPENKESNSSGVKQHNKYYEDSELYEIVAKRFEREIKFFGFTLHPFSTQKQI